jgi:YfiH family protein
MKLLDWDAPGRYRVAFSTRLGGVSEGPYASLNLGVLTDDEPDRVVVNRRRLTAAVGANPDTAAMAWQVHGAEVTEARPRGVVTPGTVYERCDGLWTDRPGQAMMLLTADCFPVALCRTSGEPALAVLHVGWKGLLAGIAEAGVEAIRDGRRGSQVTDCYLEKISAAIGPGIGPCCYEVGEEVAGPFRDRFGSDVVRGRNLDLAEATERALRAADCETVWRSDHCTACEPNLFFSHRRDQGRTGRQGIVAYID